MVTRTSYCPLTTGGDSVTTVQLPGVERSVRDSKTKPTALRGHVNTISLPSRPTCNGGRTTAAVLMTSRQPPLITPESDPWSSMMKSCQTPLGSVPLKTDSVSPYGPTGAGALKTSSPPLLVGF